MTDELERRIENLLSLLTGDQIGIGPQLLTEALAEIRRLRTPLSTSDEDAIMRLTCLLYTSDAADE